MNSPLSATAPKLAGDFVLGVVCAEGARLASQRGTAVERSPRSRAPASARALHGSAALLATSVLVDSAVEHGRGWTIGADLDDDPRR